eukprot:CAMPEP_0119553632 /NCGR_PEP_ID=MMETSP1352-20130426/6343_1 /TAXON_ID=265584 /ORGANISM="Stauroneis constricta, Strain CCMP1120" /LENGTH=516 /DNA_ID=CAMNT_0007600077 /DNA_START=91 /DNA_END=1641 /DNA_ORIENTATION=+
MMNTVQGPHRGATADAAARTSLMACSVGFLLLSMPLCASAFSAEPKAWAPKVPTLEERRHLRGLEHDSETIGSLGFHHIEFYCGDAKSTATQFASALGMQLVGTTGQATGNDQCSSYGLQSGEFRLLLTAPYSSAMAALGRAQQRALALEGDIDPMDFDAPNPLPGFHPDAAHAFFQKHGLAARAIGLEVQDASEAFRRSVEHGARPVLEPSFLKTCKGQVASDADTDMDYSADSTEQEKADAGCWIAEVELYGDVVLRYVSFPQDDDETRRSSLPFLPHLSPVAGHLAERETYGIKRIDHAVGNVPNLYEALNYVANFTGFHEFAEFTAEDVGTVDSGLNSVVLASDSEDVLLPLNEPTSGRRKSQIQTYLEQNEGAGLQHLALKTDDIFKTIRSMRETSNSLCGFELMAKPSDEYYAELPGRLGDQLSEDQYRMLEEEGILADADDEGVLLQVFTRPVGDRPTFFIEIIQRVGCLMQSPDSDAALERPGCGGFGKGNFRELFRSIEDLEKTLKV